MAMAAAANFGMFTPDEPATVTETILEPAASTVPAPAVPLTGPAAPQVEVRYEDVIVPVPASTPATLAPTTTQSQVAAGVAEAPSVTVESLVTTTSFDDHGGDDDDDDSGRGRGRGRGGDDDD
jgi:hypothetical protein